MNYNPQFKAEYKSSPNKHAVPIVLSVNSDNIVYKITPESPWATVPIAQIAGIHIYNESNVVINFGTFPYQSIVCKDAGFLKELKSQCKQYPVIARLFKSGKTTFIKLILAISALIITLLLLTYFYFIPWAVNKAATNFPLEYEKKLGKIMFEQVKTSEPFDSAKTRLLNSFFDSLHFENRIKIEILCVKQKEVNAYAIPGGYIVVYDEILNKMESKDELAGLLAHEYSHIILRHTLKNTFNSIGFSALLQIVLGSFDESVIGLIGNQAQQLRDLHYSRSLEKEADKKGFELLKLQHINPRGMINLFERLKSENTDNMPEIISTHPLPEERIKYIEELIKTDTYRVNDNKELDNLFVKLRDYDF